MIDTKALRKKWNTEKPVAKTPARKNTVKKTGKKIVKKVEKKKADPKPTAAKTAKKETVPPSAIVPVKRRQPVNKDYDNPADAHTGLDVLISKAAEAKLEEQISKAKLAEYKVEQVKLDLDLKAGNIAEVPYMEFVYISHIERMYTDLHRMIDKIKPKMNPFIMERDEDGLIKLLKKEVSETIRTVKQGQTEAVKSWKKDLKG